LTAAVSIATAIAFVPALPKLLARWVDDVAVLVVRTDCDDAERSTPRRQF